VETGNPQGELERDEPSNVAEVVSQLGLRYVVITSVDRDDLNDFGSTHYARTIRCIRSQNLSVKIEVLIPDFSGNETHIKKVIDAQPFVLGHNVETVERLTPYIRDKRCGYRQSLSVLRTANTLDNTIHTKSGFMVGLGEDKKEIEQTLKDLKASNVTVVTIGQYLQPTRQHHIVQKYYTPEEFEEFKTMGEEIGIAHVVSGPLVRSSYHAAEIL
jgi:lipoic acid synthetase